MNLPNNNGVQHKALQMFKPKLLVVLLGVALAGCSVFPQQATKEEVTARVKEDVSKMYTNQEPITAAVSLEEAVARTLKYNLDYRLKQMESALALGIADYSKYDMWPKLLANAGYNARSNYSGGTSIGIEDGIQSLRPSTSQERGYAQAGAEFSWNVLDFGVSYYRAKQNANQFLIAEERRRKLVQNMMQDVRAAYWRALGAQRLTADAADILVRADKALVKSREAEAQKVISPALALNYQRALLDATSLLNQRRQDLEFAKRELGALMSVPPGQEFTLADAQEAKLPPAPTGDMLALEEMALQQRPELREEDFKKRITADETRKQILSFMPNFNVTGGWQVNSNDFLYNKNWQQASVGMTWNLLKLFSLPALEKTQKEQVEVDAARRTALSMAILTQLRVSVERYRLAMEDYKLADTAANVDKRLADYTKASVSAKLESELEAIRTQARSVLGAYQKANAYANAQIAFGRMYNTLGFDPLEDNYGGNSIADLSQRVKAHFDETEAESLKMKSNLFGNQTKVAVKINGIQDAALQKQMQEKVVALLARNQIEHDAAGLPLTFSLKRDNKLAIDKANWSIELADKAGKVTQSAAYTTKIPETSRDSVVEATLIAAATSQLSAMKTWLSQTTQVETK